MIVTSSHNELEVQTVCSWKAITVSLVRIPKINSLIFLKTNLKTFQLRSRSPLPSRRNNSPRASDRLVTQNSRHRTSRYQPLIYRRRREFQTPPSSIKSSLSQPLAPHPSFTRTPTFSPIPTSNSYSCTLHQHSYSHVHDTFTTQSR